MKLKVMDDEKHICFGHKCDRCARCEEGFCCGELVIEANLPATGSVKMFKGMRLGEIQTDGDGKIRCHICGKYFGLLGPHLRTHKMDSHEYRAAFGFACGQSLMAPAASDKRAERAATQEWNLAKASLENLEKWNQTFTSEQRSTWATNRESRLGSHTSDPEAQRRRANMRVEAYAHDPTKHKEWANKVAMARRRLTEGCVCVVCGARFSVYSSRRTKLVSKRKTCGSDECKSEVKRRAQAASAESRRRKREAS